MEKTRKVPAKIKYSFAFGALGKDLIYGMIATFSMIYFTDILKVAPAFIGFMFCVAKLWDAFNDLYMGMIIDNTKSRFGKFVPWLVIGKLINAVIFVLVFTDFGFKGTKLLIFSSVIYILWGMTYTIMDIPYWSIIPTLTKDPRERDKVSVLPRIFASLGQSLIIAGLGWHIINSLGGGYSGFHNFAIIISITFVFTIGVCVFFLPKKDTTTENKEKIKFIDVFRILKNNDQIKWAVLLILLYNIAIQAIMTVAPYYFKYVCEEVKVHMQISFMVSASIAEVFGLIFFPFLSKKLTRKKTFFLACIFPPIGLILLFIISFTCPTNIFLTALSGIIVKFGTGLELGCATVFLSDVVDYGQYMSGKRNEGVIFSLQTLTVKLTSALSVFLIGFSLQLTGYIPNITQTPITKNAIRILMCIISALSVLVAYFIYIKKYKLNDVFMEEVNKTIK